MNSKVKNVGVTMLHCLSLLFFLTCLSSNSNAQEVLTLDDVIKITIENNFDIDIARNNIDVAKNNNNIGLVGGGQSTGGTIAGGATGMLPQISIQAGSANNPVGVGQTISTLKYADPSLNISGQKLSTSSYAPSIVGTWFFLMD